MKLTNNQKFLITICITIIGLIATNYWSYIQYSTLKEKQIVLKGEWDYLKSKIANFEKIITSEIISNCTENQTSQITVSDKGFFLKCIEK